MITGPVVRRSSRISTQGGARMPLKSVVFRGPSDDADQDRCSAGGGRQVTVCLIKSSHHCSS